MAPASNIVGVLAVYRVFLRFKSHTPGMAFPDPSSEKSMFDSTKEFRVIGFLASSGLDANISAMRRPSFSLCA